LNVFHHFPRNGEIKLENAYIDIDGEAELEQKIVSVGLISFKGIEENLHFSYTEKDINNYCSCCELNIYFRRVELMYSKKFCDTLL
jgi:hypothetical protein